MPCLLLHICCAPCSTHVISRLRNDFDLTGFFFGPNIHPEEEYQRRAQEMQRLAQQWSLPVIWGDYPVERWLKLASHLSQEGEGGSRCLVCYQIRLEETASRARQQGCDLFATTLTVSPHKRAELINPIGLALAQKYGVDFYAADFKKKDGFKKSLELSRQHHLYRQDYCGCIFSLKERDERLARLTFGQPIRGCADSRPWRFLTQRNFKDEKL